MEKTVSWHKAPLHLIITYAPFINSDITVTFIQVSLKHFVATFYVYLTQQMAPPAEQPLMKKELDKLKS